MSKKPTCFDLCLRHIEDFMDRRTAHCKFVFMLSLDTKIINKNFINVSSAAYTVTYRFLHFYKLCTAVFTFKLIIHIYM